MKMNLKVLEWLGVVTAIAYSLFVASKCRAGIPRLCFALRFRCVDRRLGLSRRTSGYLTAAVFLCGRWIDRHGAVVFMFASE